MTTIIVVIAALAGVAGLTAQLQRLIRPKTAVRLLLTLTTATCLSIVVALTLVTLGFLARVPVVASLLGWCRHVVSAGLPWWLGAAGATGLLAICAAAGRTWLGHRRLRSRPGDEPVLVVAMDAALAYSVGGRPGQIVVSSGMLRCLDPDQRRVLFAHEQSHLRHHHHRYLRIADLTAAVPILRPLRNQIRYAVERWADEDAAAEVGSRELVAATLARAALAQSDAAPAAALAAAGGGVPERVHALLAGKRPSGGRAGLAAALGAAGLVGSLATLSAQVQQVVASGTHLCPF